MNERSSAPWVRIATLAVSVVSTTASRSPILKVSAIAGAAVSAAVPTSTAPSAAVAAAWRMAERRRDGVAEHDIAVCMAYPLVIVMGAARVSGEQTPFLRRTLRVEPG